MTELVAVFFAVHGSLSFLANVDCLLDPFVVTDNPCGRSNVLGRFTRSMLCIISEVFVVRPSRFRIAASLIVQIFLPADSPNIPLFRD